MALSHMKVSSRLNISFGIVLLMLVLVAAIGINRMGQINTRLNSIVNVNNVEQALASTLNVSLYEQSMIARDYLLAPDASARKGLSTRLTQELANYRNIEKQLDDMFTTLAETADIEKATMAEVKALTLAAQPMLQQMAELASADKPDELRQLLASGLAAKQAQRRTKLTELIDLEQRLNREAGAEALGFYVSAKNSMLVLGALALLIGIALAVMISRSLTQQLGGEPLYAANIANRIAAGDLTNDVAVTGSQPSLMQAIRLMNNGLQKIVSEVRTGSDAIASATDQIATGNLDLSARTEEQASSIEETAAAVEQLTSTVRQNADNAAQANELASAATTTVEEAGSAVQKMVATMNAIDDSSKKIVSIINVIDGISFQTNILALNAAVEAARAGEQGRGFAVVASEVRSLAQRSASAAKEIKGLIEESVNTVSHGYQLVQQTETTMNHAVDSIRKVSGVVAEITAAGREQATGIAQVNDAISQMDQTTQQNAALVEEAAAAAQTLQRQARQLLDAVSVFSITPGAAKSDALRVI